MVLSSRCALVRVAAVLLALLAFTDPGGAQISQPPPGGGTGIVETPPAGGGSGIARPPPGGGGATPGGGGGVTPPPPPPPPADLAIFIAVNGQTTGPFGTAALEAKVANGELRADTLVWKQGMGAWAPASSLPELTAMLNAHPGGGGGGGGIESAAAFLAGTWGYTNVTVPMDGGGQGTLNGQISYAANGQMTFQGTMDIFMQGQNQRFTISGQGTFTAQRLDANRIEVNTQSSMTFSNPMMGSNTQTSSEVTVLTVQDRNTVIDDEGNRATRIN